MDNPLVSVILPFYNAGEHLQQAVNSILAQSYPQVEVLLVNNNSNDQSLAAAQQFAKQHPHVQLLHQSNQGVVHAFNHGLSQAQGALVARMDADDISHPQRLAKQVELLTNNPNIGVASCLVQYGGSAQTKKGFAKYVTWQNRLQHPQDIYLNRFVEFPVVNPTLMFRRQLFRQHGSYHHGDFPEDYELFLRWQAAGVQFSKVPQTLFQWNDLPQRLTWTHTSYTPDAFYRIKAKYLATWLQSKGISSIAVWGSGRISRKRSAMLQQYGIAINFYIDVVQPKEQGGIPVVHYSQLNQNEQPFIVSYVANHGAGTKIRDYLTQKAYTEGVQFILAA